MKFQLMSDLHLECHVDRGREFLASVEPAADILVLAGDIASAKLPDQLLQVFSAMKKKFKHVIFVPGNHEFYRTTPWGAWHSIRRAAEIANHDRECVHLLDNDALELDGVRWFGGTGWFADPNDEKRCRRFTDFTHIRELAPWVYEEHATFARRLAWLRPDVVVSHHLPDQRCVDAKFKGERGNDFFVANFDVEGSGAKAWVHGHSHRASDLFIGSTYVTSNPFGYSHEMWEQMAFNPVRVVQI